MTRSAIIAGTILLACLVAAAAADNTCFYDVSDHVAIAYAMCDRLPKSPRECDVITQRWLGPLKEPHFDADLAFIKFVAGLKE